LLSAAIIARVTPPLLVAAGVTALVAGAAILRTFGHRYRVGRLLASSPKVSVADAVAMAVDGPARYVRIEGRIDAENEFEDADHRPLVFRRTHLEARLNGRWTTFEEGRESVPFEVHEGTDAIAIDAAAIDTGLVVVRRESEGVAADLAEASRGMLASDTPVRAVIEQVSSIEHAIVVGVPVQGSGPGAPPTLTAGLGRPLVLTTLEPDEAMRILAGGTGRPRVVAACFVVGALLVAAGLAWGGIGALTSALVPVALAASPTPAPGGDPRSAGEGPGLVGEPGLAILAVVAIAVIAIVVTTAYVRLTGGAEQRRSRR
jgi:hypothetical protein